MAMQAQLEKVAFVALLNPKLEGCPRLVVDADTVARVRAQGASWRAISTTLGLSPGTVYSRIRCDTSADLVPDTGKIIPKHYATFGE